MTDHAANLAAALRACHAALHNLAPKLDHYEIPDEPARLAYESAGEALARYDAARAAQDATR